MRLLLFASWMITLAVVQSVQLKQQTFPEILEDEFDLAQANAKAEAAAEARACSGTYSEADAEADAEIVNMIIKPIISIISKILFGEPICIPIGVKLDDDLMTFVYHPTAAKVQVGGTTSTGKVPEVFQYA